MANLSRRLRVIENAPRPSRLSRRRVRWPTDEELQEVSPAVRSAFQSAMRSTASLPTPATSDDIKRWCGTLTSEELKAIIAVTSISTITKVSQ